MLAAAFHRSALAVLALSLLAGCREADNPLGPDAKYLKLSILSGDGQFGRANTLLADSLRVHVTFQVDGFPANRAIVYWKVLSGPNAVISPEETRTNETGVSSTSIVLSALGQYEIEARIVGSTVRTVRFKARAVPPPTIDAVQPQQTQPGETLTITGRNFSTVANENTVSFDGVQAAILSASATEIRARVPECIPARQVNVVAALGAVTSQGAAVQISANPNNLLQMTVGQVVTLPRSASQSCVQLPADPNAAYLLVTQNVSRSYGQAMPYQLLGLAQGSTPLTPRAVASPTPAMTNPAMTGVALDFERRLRARERTFHASDAIVNQPAEVQAALQSASLSRMDTEIGDHKRFTVLNKAGAYVNMDAEVKAISRYAVVYQEVGTRVDDLTPEEYLALAKVIEDPIYETNTRVFGSVSDVDADGRIAVVLTSVVNRMTAPTDPGFIAGFFDACDLLVRACVNSNRGEFFYTIMPDPEGVYGKKHTTEDILRRLPPNIAHEMMHMIHFNQRVTGLRAQEDESWLKEALAHMAEDTVAGVLLNRGDPRAGDFLVANYIRAYLYLAATSNTSLIYFDAGTLEERGAGWLLLRYLLGHSQGDMLRQLTRSSVSGIANIEAVAKKTWETLLGEWAVALWADNAPELGSPPLESRYTFTNMNLRDALGTSQPQAPFNGTYALRPPEAGFVDFLNAGVIQSGSQSYMLIKAGQNAQPIVVNLTGPRGAALPVSARAQISLLRVR
jgi:hypothetical protein